MFHLTLIFYPHHTGMRSQMLYTSVSFEICQERMFVKQRRTHGWSTYLLSKEIFMLKQKSSNLYMICFNSVKKFWVIIYALCIGMRSQMLYTNAGAELGGCLGGPLPPKILPGPPSGPPKIRSLSESPKQTIDSSLVAKLAPPVPPQMKMSGSAPAQTGHLKSAKSECLWSLLSKKIFMLKQKSSNLYMIGFNSVIKFLSDCLSTLH